MNFRDAEVDLLRGVDPALGHSTYPGEFCQLYMGQGLAADPAVYRLITSGQSVTSSADEPAFTEPKDISALKLDFGIKTRCRPVYAGNRGPALLWPSPATRKHSGKLLGPPDILTRYFSLCYMRCKLNL